MPNRFEFLKIPNKILVENDKIITNTCKKPKHFILSKSAGCNTQLIVKCAIREFKIFRNETVSAPILVYNRETLLLPQFSRTMAYPF